MKSSNSGRILEKLLGNKLDYSRVDTSFSPFYSDIGLGINSNGGIACLFLHYNRETTEFLKPFLSMPVPVRPHKCETLGVTQYFNGAKVQIAFCSHNTWIVDCEGRPSLEFGIDKKSKLTEKRCRKFDASIVLLEGYLPTTDKRDPDRHFPVVLGVRVINGTLTSGDGIEQPLQIHADSKKRLTLAFSVRMLEVGHAAILSRLKTASFSAEDAVRRSRAWLAKAMGGLRILSGGRHEKTVLARAVHCLLSNATAAPGLLAGRISVFPNRGRYPTHFLWDSCFQNLATEYMEPRLASDSLLLLIQNLRADGKMPHFICSTWVRPDESQPPLVGWAGLRLVRERNDKQLASQLLPALRRNTQWWLSQRMTRFGLIAALHGLETGWDNSPRFDAGPTVACDMNSYLLLQMRACVELSKMIGADRSAKEQTIEADRYAQRMVDVLYDKDAGLFWDINVKSGDPIKIKTPACFLPILAGVPLPDDKTAYAIEKHLLNRNMFFGDVPFPSVAYDEACYEPGRWWRGPTWLPVAYLMLMVLDKTGYHKESAASRKRLYRMILDDGNIRELFNSQTGQGLGAYEQSWTAAICLRLHHELSRA